MREQILAYCKRQQEQAVKNQDWASAQDYQDMHTMWKKRFESEDAKKALAA